MAIVEVMMDANPLEGNFWPLILECCSRGSDRTLLMLVRLDLEVSTLWVSPSQHTIIWFYCRRWRPSNASLARTFDLSSFPSLQREQVILSYFNFFHLPTTSTNCIIKGYTNTQVRGVYKYPNMVTISYQSRNELSVGSKYLPANAYSLNFNPKRSSSFILSSFIKSFLSATDFCWFVSGGMAASPRSVLDASFQCEAAPIFLEEQPSSVLVQALNHTLAGKLLTARRPSVANLTIVAARLWNCPHRLSCFDHGKCLYSFEFTFPPDVEKVVAGGPWYINGDLLLISRMNPNQSIEQLLFAYTKLWVRCYDLPPKCFTKEYAAAIGNSLGKFCETDLPPENPEEARLLVRKTPTVRKYLRVKFDFNLYGPLKSTQEIKICNSKKQVVEVHISRLTYERLPHTCFRCGFIGHLMEGCSFEGPMLYGEWIRAEKFFRINQVKVIPRTNSSNKEGQSSSSLQAENQVSRVSNVADLVNAMVEDPNIIKANYSQARAEGPLPISKGKAPLIPSIDSGNTTSHSGSLIPYSDISPPKSISPKTVFGPPGDSIMGPAPSFMRLHSSPNGPDPILIDSDEGHFVSYLNAIPSHDDPFATNPNRCLFKNDIPASGSSPKGISVSTFVPIPVAIVDTSAISVGATRLISSVFKEEISKLPPRKRGPNNPLTPRPKRGRQSSAPDGQA